MLFIMAIFFEGSLPVVKIFLISNKSALKALLLQIIVLVLQSKIIYYTNN